MNIEQLIAVLLDEGRLGGFHLNNRKYADDDLMAGLPVVVYRALLVDRPALRQAQADTGVVLANRLLMSAFEQDVGPLLAQVRVEMGRDPDPLAAYRRGGCAVRVAAARRGKGINTLGGG